MTKVVFSAEKWRLFERRRHRRRMLPRRIELCFLLVALFSFPFTAMAEEADAVLNAANDPTEILRPQDFWAIAGSARDQPHPLHMEIRINFVDTAWHNFWYEQQGEPGYFPLSAKPPVLKPGQLVKLDGTVVPSTGLEASRLKVTLLADPDPTPAEDVKGRFNQMLAIDRHRVQVDAFVDTTTWIDQHHTRLALIVEGRPAIGWIWTEAGEKVPDWNNKFVRLRSIYSGRTDPTGTQAEVELWTPNAAAVEVLYPISEDPQFELPITPIDTLFQVPFGPRLRVRGRVQSQEPGSSIVVRDDTGQVSVETAQEFRFPVGSTVDIIGSAGISGSTEVLKSGLIRQVTGVQSDLGTEDSSGVLRLVEQVRRLTPDEAARGRRVALSGVVTWDLPELPYLYLQDLSGGIRVRFRPGAMALPYIGQRVYLDGHTYSYESMAGVELEHLTQVTSMRMPQALQVSLAQMMTGSAEGQWVETSGFLRNFEIIGERTRLDVIAPEGEFSAVIQTPEHLDHMLNALIRLRGVCEAVVDKNEKITGVKLWIPYLHNLLVDTSAPTDVFDTPLRSIATVRQLSAGTQITRARVSGVVLHQEPGQSLFIESDRKGLLVLTAGREKLLPGDQIEAVGVVGREGTRALLRDSVYRQVGNGPEPVPVVIADPEVLNENLDGRLVKVRGTLINQFARADRARLTLKKGQTFFEAMVARDARSGETVQLPLESGLELTGIYRVVFDDARQTRGFELLVRNPQDIKIYRPARFWTIQRMAAAAEILGACLLLGVAWVTALRRRLHRQTDQIRGQLQKELVLEARHQGIFENASDFIFMTDLEGRFTSFNPAGERVTGYTHDDALRMNIRDLLQLEKEKDIWKQPNLNVGGDGTVTFQTQLRTKTGQLVWAEISSRLIRDSGQVVSILGIVHDISEHKQIEEELKRARDAAEANTRAKSEFLANMSHEIRTPMNAVIGMSNLLLDTRLDERQKDFAETIRNGAEALLTILNDILDFSKMEAGRLQIETVDFDLRETVDGTVELLAARAAAKNLELTGFIPAKLPSALCGDPNRLRQVLLNMLGNAIKFTEHGEVLLQISVESESPTEAVFLFEIIDSGVGIGPSEQAGLFRPFTQADSSTTRRFGGTGLGLAISKQIVELLGGRCGVRSALGEGSTFWFTARFGKQADAVHELGAPSEFTDVRVLLVDDSTTACRLLDHYVSAWRMRATDANSGEEALRLLGAAAATDDPFSVAIIDTQLPDQDGLQLARMMRENPALGSVRIVFLNTIKRAIMPAEMAEVGLAVSLLKPIRQTELLSALMRVLAENHMASAAAKGALRPTRGLTAVASVGIQPVGSLSSHNPAPLRVLLAEDNPVNQRVALLQLAKLGHAAHAVSNGLEVIAEMDRNQYDVILMDCHMPEMDGFESTRRLRADPRFARTRIVALTANAMQGDREKCLAAGMDDYLSKPVRVAELQAALARCIPTVSR